MAAEEVVLGERSIGAGGVIGSDLEEETKIATLMAAAYGLGVSLRFATPAAAVGESFRPSSEVVCAVEMILRREYQAAKDLLLLVKEEIRSIAPVLVANKQITLAQGEVMAAFDRSAPRASGR